jgi:tripartite-type tricarboxylate transporter receptor subunit TctC
MRNQIQLMLFVCVCALVAAFEKPGYGDEIFRGKTINLYAAGGIGGGYDLYARLLAAHYAKHIPGSPNIVVRNMPGAGGLKAANYIYEVAAKDGTAIAAIGGGAATAEMFKLQGVQFDPRRLVWIGSMNAEVGLAISWGSSPVKSINDVFVRDFVVGGTGPTDGNVVFATVLNKELATKFKLVAGYKSTTEIALAIERGELEGTASIHYSSLMASKPDWLTENKVNVLLQLALSPHSMLPDVPMVMDLAKTDEQRDVIRLVFARQEMGRPFTLPPGTGHNIATPLREGFQAALKDAALIADAERQRMDLNQTMTNAQIEELIAKLYQTAPALIMRAAIATEPGKQ